ncbi:MAG: hypothetical protein ACREQ4_17250 [Candidatus Binataceae bacterium]
MPRLITSPHLILIGASLALLVSLGGCAARFKDIARNNPECSTAAQIPPFKVNDCLSTTRHRDEFNTCLTSRGVPPWQLKRLNDCIDAHRHSGIF